MIGERLNITTEEYERTRGDYLSAHMIDLFDLDPALIPAQRGRTPTPEMELGTAFHCFFLEPEEFEKTYVIANGPINEKTGAPYGRNTKKFEEFLAQYPNCKIITQKDYDTFQVMKSAILSSESVEKSGFLSVDCENEVAIKMDVADVPIRGRIDSVNFISRRAYDLKTCANIDQFEKDLRYNSTIRWQVFIYSMLADSELFYIIAVEKNAPYRVRTYLISKEAFEYQSKNFLNILESFKMCVRSGKWNSCKSTDIITIQ